MNCTEPYILPKLLFSLISTAPKVPKDTIAVFVGLYRPLREIMLKNVQNSSGIVKEPGMCRGPFYKLS